MSSSKKVLLLNPPTFSGDIYFKEIGRCGSKSVSGEIWPQTGLAYLAAVLEAEGHVCMIIDSFADSIDVEETIRKAQSFYPDVIVIHTSTPTFTNDSKICALLSERLNSKIGFIGTHVSALPVESLQASKADFVIINEGEETLVELVREFDSCWDGIKGLCFRKNGEIVKNSERLSIENLDSLPFPARHLLPNSKYKMSFTNGRPFVTVIPSRGCPYPCIFCRAGRVWGSKTRYRSVKNVYLEVESIIEDLGITDIVFMTDTFTQSKKWVIDFCEIVINNQLNIRWICNSRVDTIDEEMLVLMKKAGCFLIAYGVESGSQSILNGAKKHITVEQSAKAISLTNEVGIESFAYFILGLPGENWDTINQSISFAKKLKPSYVQFHVATPFPGTEFYDMAKTNNWLITSNWEEFEEGSAVISTGVLSAHELLNAQKLAMKNFYLRPSQLFKEIKKIRSFAELKEKFKAGWNLFKPGIIS